MKKKKIDTAPLCQHILSLIGEGEANAVHKEDLCNATGLEERHLRKIIEQLRLNGTVIAANASGYFFPVIAAELRAYISQERSRASATFAVVEAAEQRLSELEAGNKEV